MDKLQKMYYSPGGLVLGPSAARKLKAKIPELKEGQIQHWLDDQPVYQIYKPKFLKFPRDFEYTPPILTPTETKEKCSICLDNIDKAVATLCSHIFHEACIKEWAINSNNCPVCRQCVKLKIIS